MIELGGNIKLDGFDNLEPAKLIVIKKLSGSHTKKITEKTKDFKEIIINLKSETPYKIELQLFSEKNHTSIAEDKNLFYAFDKAFLQLTNKL